MSARKGQRDLKKELRDRNFQLSQKWLGKNNYTERLKDFSPMRCAGSRW